MTLAEECIKIKVGCPREWYEPGTLEGWTTVHYKLSPDDIQLSWEQHIQRIRRVKILYRTFGGSIYYECPLCGKVTHTLYLPPNGVSFGCAQCHKVRYKAWRTCGQWRQPKTPEAWLKWFIKRARRALHEQELNPR